MSEKGKRNKKGNGRKCDIFHGFYIEKETDDMLKYLCMKYNMPVSKFVRKLIIDKFNEKNEEEFW